MTNAGKREQWTRVLREIVPQNGQSSTCSIRLPTSSFLFNFPITLFTIFSGSLDVGVSFRRTSKKLLMIQVFTVERSSAKFFVSGCLDGLPKHRDVNTESSLTEQLFYWNWITGVKKHIFSFCRSFVLNFAFANSNYKLQSTQVGKVCVHQTVSVLKMVNCWCFQMQFAAGLKNANQSALKRNLRREIWKVLNV